MRPLVVLLLLTALSACSDEQPAQLLGDTDAWLCLHPPRADAVDVAEDVLEGGLELSPHEMVHIPDEPRWDENPLEDSNWQFQYHTLRWLRPLIDAWDETDDARFRVRYTELLHSWWVNNPVGDPPSQFSWNDHSTAHRATVYACAATALPDEGWLLEAVEDHGEMLSSPDFYVEHSNHALNQNTGLLASGCLLDRDDWTSTALKRLEVLVEDSIDEQGVTNEQAIDYQYYNMAMYKKAQEYLETCDLAPPATFERLDLMPDFLSHATMPNGDYVMLATRKHGLPATSAAPKPSSPPPKARRALRLGN